MFGMSQKLRPGHHADGSAGLSGKAQRHAVDDDQPESRVDRQAGEQLPALQQLPRLGVDGLALDERVGGGTMGPIARKKGEGRREPFPTREG